MNYLEELVARFTKPEAVAFGFGAVLTAILSHLWRRVQGRMFVLRFSARHLSLARSSDDVFGNKLQVLYRGNEVKGLYITEAHIRNDSGTDLENVVITLEYRNGETFYGGSGRVSGLSKNLNFSPEFQVVVDRYLAIKENSYLSPDLPYILRTREFIVPVLNRDATIDFSILTHSEKFPYLYPVCSHKGVKIVEEKEVQKLLGVPNTTAGLVGLVVGILVLLAIVDLFPSSGWAAFWAFFIGSCAALIGVGCVWGFRLLSRLLGR